MRNTPKGVLHSQPGMLQPQGCILYHCLYSMICSKGHTERKPLEGERERERDIYKIQACPAHDAPRSYFE